MTESAYIIAVDAKTKTENLEERFDRHLKEIRDEIKFFRQEAQELRELLSTIKLEFHNKITEAKLSALEDSKQTNVNFYKQLLAYSTGGASAGGIFGVLYLIAKMKGA